MFGLFIIYVTLWLSCPGSAIVTDCNDGWTAYNGSCYQFGHDTMTYLEAEKFCEHLSAHMVSVNNEGESAFLSSFLDDYKYPYHWLGITDELVEGQWVWQDTNAAYTFSNWYPGQPDGRRTSNCAVINAGLQYKWSDQYCTQAFHPLCEYEPMRHENVLVG